jgi:hypothetical protein
LWTVIVKVHEGADLDSSIPLPEEKKAEIFESHLDCSQLVQAGAFRGVRGLSSEAPPPPSLVSRLMRYRVQVVATMGESCEEVGSACELGQHA